MYTTLMLLLISSCLSILFFLMLLWMALFFKNLCQIFVASIIETVEFYRWFVYPSTSLNSFISSWSVCVNSLVFLHTVSCHLCIPLSLSVSLPLPSPFLPPFFPLVAKTTNTRLIKSGESRHLHIFMRKEFSLLSLRL